MGYDKCRLAQCQENVTEWDIASRPDFPVKKHYEVAMTVYCHYSVPVWYDLRGYKELSMSVCRQPVMLHRTPPPLQAHTTNQQVAFSPVSLLPADSTSNLTHLHTHILPNIPEPQKPLGFNSYEHLIR